MFTETTDQAWSLKKVVHNDVTIYEMDAKEDVLIGQAIWKGSQVMSNWMQVHQDLFNSKKVLELGSGPGLCGFTAGKLGASKVILTDYKEPVMELIAHNIKQQVNQN